MDPAQLTQSLKSIAGEVGFDWCGACPAVQPAGYDRLLQWLDAGFHGEMEWMPRRRAAYAHPRHVLDGARSLLVLAMAYSNQPARPAGDGTGRVARYAWGTVDYHAILRTRMRQLRQRARQLHPELVTRGIVDTAPLMEREFAVLAGLGWQGKNSLLLNRRLGSWFFLAVVILDVELDYDPPHESRHCGTCSACLDACPTGAFVAPGVLDARRCISYLTIELQTPIPRELREPMGDWVFGCDVCQEVCPWNHRAADTGEQAFRPVDSLNPLPLAELFYLDEESFRRRFGQTPLWRARRRGLLRNAAIALGNQRDAAAVPALRLGLVDDDPLVRGASAWGLGRIRGSRRWLQDRWDQESDPGVRQEIDLALREAD